MTQQSIGGRNAQDGISGTPSGTQGADSGQGINQGGQSQQSAQGHSQHLVGSASGQGGIGNQQRTEGDPQAPNRDRYGDQETGATSGEVGDGRSPRQVAVSGSQATQHSAGGSLQQDSERAARQESHGERTTGPGGSGMPAEHLQGGPGNKRPYDDRQGGPGNSQSQETPSQQQQQQQAGPSDKKGQSQQNASQQSGSQQNAQSADKPRAGTGGGHGGQHSGGMGGERGGPLHNVGAQSGQTGRGGLGGNNVEMQGSSKGNQQSGDNLIGQTTLGSGGGQSADRDSLDALPADAMGGERVGMGSRGHSQQSDKAGNAQGGTWKNQAVPNNRSDNEQADRQLGMQGSQGEPGHDIDDLGNKQSGGRGGSQGGTEDQR